MKKGFFIVIDGIDGSGTTTHSKLLAEWLGENYEVLITQEPSDHDIGELIRKLLKTSLPAAVDALLFAADRAIHTEEIKKALKNGKIVISDRYLESSICYQGVELDKDWITILNKFAIRPNLTIILDINPEIGLNRKKDCSEKFEKIEFLINVRNNFLNRAKNLKYKVIDTSKSIDEVQKEIRDYVKTVLNL
ncbi:MAG: dTMP kinase [Candidatus Helarchaeota archaeon]